MIGVGVDPGRRKFAWAVVADGELASCGLVQVHDRNLLETAAQAFWEIEEAGGLPGDTDAAAVERPQVYRTGPLAHSNPMDLNDLICLSAMLATHYYDFDEDIQVYLPVPRTWKGGGIQKKINHNRLRDRFPNMAALVAAAGVDARLRLDIQDAVGIAAYAHDKALRANA